MDYSTIAERISRMIADKGHTVEKGQVEGRLRRLIDEFGIPADEAERTVIRDLSREFSLEMPARGGGPGTPAEERAIASVLPEEWVTVTGKVVTLTKPNSPSIRQTGILADRSGAIRFVIWAKSDVPEVREDTWYRFESAVVDAYRDVPNLKVHSGTKITPLADEGSIIPQVTPIGMVAPGVVSVHAKVVQEYESRHERILQSGLLGDESGTIRFTIWKEEGKERLVPGKAYYLYYALADLYGERVSLVLNTATCIPDDDAEITVKAAETTHTGVLVHIAPPPGSGIIRRCTVEGCNRALSRQNFCPVHEMQSKFNYDLRIRGWLDDGQQTHEVLMPRAVVEGICAMTLDQAKEIAENQPLGMDEVHIRMRDRILGRYYTCSGREIERRLFVNRAEPVRFDNAVLASLLNRVGGDTA